MEQSDKIEQARQQVIEKKIQLLLVWAEQNNMDYNDLAEYVAMEYSLMRETDNGSIFD